MRDELDKMLCERYPKMFVNRYADMKETAMCWGFDHGDGWFNIIDHLCNNIQSHIDWRNSQRELLWKDNPYNRPIRDEIPQVVVDQVKEKFGTLRFYYHGGDEVIDDDVISAKPLVELKDSIEELAMAYLVTDTMVEHPQSWIYGDYYSSTELSCLKIRYMDQLLRLADPMQSIMLFRYQLDWDFTAIANMLGVSKGRVSQLHKAALDALRANKADVDVDVDDGDEFFQLSGIPA